jgi:hypothetical protein
MASRKNNLKKGQVMLLTAIFFMAFTITVCLGFVNPTVQQVKTSSGYWNIKNSYYLTESGIEESIYRFANGLNLYNNENFLINDSTIFIYPSGEEGHKFFRSEYNGEKMKTEAHKAGDNKFEILDWREIQ